MKLLFITLSALALLSIVAVHVAAVSDVNIFDAAPWIGVILFVGILIPFMGFRAAANDRRS